MLSVSAFNMLVWSLFSRYYCHLHKNVAAVVAAMHVAVAAYADVAAVVVSQLLIQKRSVKWL